MANVSICKMTEEVKTALKKFRLRKEKNIAAIVLKIDKAKLEIVIDEEHDDISVEELQGELPSHLPRYVVLSYVKTHDDGRVTYPLIFIFISPEGCNPEQHMMYAGSKLQAVQDGGLTKEMELRSLEDLTDENILEKLKLFK